jgi:membrane associated rhomboid family serine protease
MNEASVGHQCPECVAEGRRTVRPARTAFGGTGAGAAGHVTIALIALNVLAFFATIISSGSADSVAGGGLGGLIGGFTPLHEWGAQVTQPMGRFVGTNEEVPLPGGLVDGEFYRMFTSMFLHYGALHLLLNMWGLWILGRPLEELLGRARFVALYLLSGLGGSVSVYLFSDPNGFTAGASGAIFGLFAALIVVLRRMRRSVAGIVPVLVINLVITLGVPGISIAGHFGGMVTGAAVAAGLAYAPRTVRTPVQVATIVGVLVLLGVLTIGWTLALPAVPT